MGAVGEGSGEINKYKILINPFAEQDIIEAIDWYNDKKDGLGNELFQEIKKSIKRIENNPHQFPVMNSGIHRALINRFPFSLFYVINAENINVFAAFHSSRNPKIWKIRKPKTAK